MSTSAHALRDIRSRIDRLDQRLVELLALRQAAVDDIAEVKEQSDRCVRDPKRESELIDRLRDIAREHDVSADLVEDLYGTIIEHSVARQSSRRSDAPSTSRPTRLRKVS
jgi:chorismate mutase